VSFYTITAFVSIKRVQHQKKALALRDRSPRIFFRRAGQRVRSGEKDPSDGILLMRVGLEREEGA